VGYALCNVFSVVYYNSCIIITGASCMFRYIRDTAFGLLFQLEIKFSLHESLNIIRLGKS